MLHSLNLESSETGRPVLANYAQQYIEYCLANFDMYWLTTHCRGSADTAVSYLRPYCSLETLVLREQIKATDFKTFKTEAL